MWRRLRRGTAWLPRPWRARGGAVVVAEAPGGARRVRDDRGGLRWEVSIENGADIAAVRARLNQSPGDAVVLRIPRGHRTMQSALGMQLLQRHAQANRLLVIIETRDGRIRRLAREYGLTVVGSMRRRRMDRGRLVSRTLNLRVVRVPVPAIGAVLRLIFGAAALVAMLGALLLVAPRTVVRLAPELTPVSVRVTVNARLEQDLPIVESAGLVAQRREVEVRVSDSAVTTGSVEIPASAARGVVRFVNRTEASLTIPRGTRVFVPDGPAYRTQTDAVLPVTQGVSVDVIVLAEEAGSGSNIPGGSVTEVEAAFLEQVTVDNPDPISGGVSDPKRGASAEDLRRLRETALHLFQQAGLEQLVQEGEGRFVFAPESMEARVDEEILTPPPEEPGDLLTLTLRGRVAVFAVDLDDLRDLAERQIRAERGSGFMIVRESLTPGETLELTIDQEAGTMRFDMVLDGYLAAVVIPEAVKSDVRFKRPSRAEASLNQTLELRRPADVSITPGFLPITSPFNFRLRVEIDTTIPLSRDQEALDEPQSGNTGPETSTLASEED